MTPIQVQVDVRRSSSDQSVVIPVAVPSLDEVRALASRLHRSGLPFEDEVWGWPVYYEPEIREDEAAFEIPDGAGGFRTEYRPFWSPASFTIGESGVWFFSLLWENGRDEAPVEFLDDRNLITT